MTQRSLPGMYFEYHIPLGLYNLIGEVIERNQSMPNIPWVPSIVSHHMWFSQPRSGSDPLTEVLTVNFKVPLSVSELSWEVVRVGCRMEVWYCDRQNNWRQVLDESRNPVALTLSASQAAAWYKAHFYCYPIVAKKLQFRFTRIPDPVVGNAPYCVGMRNALIRRNIYTRSDGTQGIEPQQDVLGNTFTSYIKDWDASQAFDNDPVTYWRSMPMADPTAVCALYLDCRAAHGSAQLIDGVYLDPVYPGQALNIYYSNDDTVGTLKLSPVSVLPTSDENTDWWPGKGRWDSSSSPGTSSYEFPFVWGPLVSQDCWVGIEWAPDFDPTDGPPENPVLFEVTPVASDGSQYWPKIYYDVGGAKIVLELYNGTTTKTYSVPLSPLPIRYTPLRIVVGWSYDPSTVFISVKTGSGAELAADIVVGTGGGAVTTAGNLAPDATLPTLITLDGTIGFTDFRGLFTAHVVKLESVDNAGSQFQANPQVYVSPDPVVPDNLGNIPVTSLDNAIYAAAWTMQENGTGGGHESRYDDKIWTPIWRDYLTQKGKLLFPQQISMKYVKLEFTNLTPEPYPVFDSGIQTRYRVFPGSVTQAFNRSTGSNNGGLLTLGGDVALTGIGSVNFLNPSTVQNAVNTIYGQTIQPVQVSAGPGPNVTSLPNMSQLDVNAQTRQEVSTPWIYRRGPLDPTVLAAQVLNAAAAHDTMASSAIGNSFTPLVSYPTRLPTLPSQGNDWWVFPGATLRMPASIMRGLTGASETTLQQNHSTQARLRFVTSCIHRYDTKTAMRDAGVAYFAGIREVQPLVATYISELDPDVFTFSSYDDSQWIRSNIRSLDSGPITTAGSLYEVLNPGFDQGIDLWDQVQGHWSHDPADNRGHWHPGSATVVFDGTEKELKSSIIRVTPGVHLDASVWVEWEGMVAANDTEALQLRALYYNDDVYVSSQMTALSYSPWPSNTPLLSGNHWAKIVASLAGGNQFVVPDGVNILHLSLVATAAATAGQGWFDTVEIATTDTTEGTVFKDFVTTSTFAKVACKFSDSGLVRSDDMWAREDPLAVNIPFTNLAYYTTTIPDVIPAGMWSDTFADWADDTITWGAPRALVAINVDPDRLYQGRRVLHFSRAGLAEEAGIKIRQIVNYVAGALFRIGAVFYKPNSSINQVTLRLRRVSDGVYIHEETFSPVCGYWFEYQTDFIEIPDSEDQIYTVELVLTGDAPDEFYLNDLYTEVADIRYFVRLGGEEEFLHDVTPLVYADPPAIVTTTEPVNEFSVQTVVLSPRSFAYSCELIPTYLK